MGFKQNARRQRGTPVRTRNDQLDRCDESGHCGPTAGDCRRVQTRRRVRLKRNHPSPRAGSAISRKGSLPSVADLRASYADSVSHEANSPPAGVELFDSPEKAALAGWRSTPSARACVVAVQPSQEFDGVYVTVATDGHPGFHDRDISMCVRAPNGKWWESGSAGACGWCPGGGFACGPQDRLAAQFGTMPTIGGGISTGPGGAALTLSIRSDVAASGSVHRVRRRPGGRCRRGLSPVRRDG